MEEKKYVFNDKLKAFDDFKNKQNVLPCNM